MALEEISIGMEDVHRKGQSIKYMKGNGKFIRRILEKASEKEMQLKCMERNGILKGKRNDSAALLDGGNEIN